MKTITSKYGTEWTLRREIKVEKFVWHCTYRDLARSHYPNENDYSLRERIKKEGLVLKDKNWAIFVNNGIIEPQYIFPFCIDHFTFRDKIQDVLRTMLRYDLWRIDTSLLKADWWVDPLMSFDIDKSYPKMKKEWFVCTRENIPPEALKLYTLKESQFDEIGKVKIHYSDGAAHAVVRRWQENFTPHIWGDNTDTTKPLNIAA